MERLILRSTSAEALRAELHRSQLLMEAASHRKARSAGPDVATLVPGRHETIIGWLRAALGGTAIDRGRQSAEC
jgi:hypothetical protein